ncbi:hypothetical protein KKG66_11350, partial [bacterium]|nr:hypothetical protein [bacterium]
MGMLSDGSRQELSISCSWADGLTVGLWDQREGGVSNSGEDSLLARRTLRSLTTLDSKGRPLFDVHVLPNEEGFA